MADQKTKTGDKPTMTAADATRAVSESMLRKAVDDAAAALHKNGIISKEATRSHAYTALRAGGDALRAENTMRLSGLDVPRQVAIAGVAVGTLLLDLVALGAVAVHGPARVRKVAGVAVAGHIALYVIGRTIRRRVKARIATGLATAADRSTGGTAKRGAN